MPANTSPDGPLIVALGIEATFSIEALAEVGVPKLAPLALVRSSQKYSEFGS